MCVCVWCDFNFNYLLIEGEMLSDPTHISSMSTQREIVSESSGSCRRAERLVSLFQDLRKEL